MIEMLEKGVKYVQTIKTPRRSDVFITTKTSVNSCFYC